MKIISNKKTMITTAALAMTFAFTACGGGNTNTVTEATTGISESSKEAGSSEATGDINIDSLRESAENIKNLDLGIDKNNSSDTTEAASEVASETTSEATTAVTVDTTNVVRTNYSYTDVDRAGTDLTIIPNGGLNGSTLLFNDKDLNGFLDYVDSTVLEAGRTIDRQLFYDVLATMLVDKELSNDPKTIEGNMLMALAMADNFHASDVKIKDCYLDANNAADYHFNLTAYGKEDTWLVNFSKRTVYFNDGKTEYVSDMFKDEYLAVWFTAVEDYFGLSE